MVSGGFSKAKVLSTGIDVLTVKRLVDKELKRKIVKETNVGAELHRKWLFGRDCGRIVICSEVNMGFRNCAFSQAFFTVFQYTQVILVHIRRRYYARTQTSNRNIRV